MLRAAPAAQTEEKAITYKQKATKEKQDVYTKTRTIDGTKLMFST